MSCLCRILRSTSSLSGGYSPPSTFYCSHHMDCCRRARRLPSDLTRTYSALGKNSPLTKKPRYCDPQRKDSQCSWSLANLEDCGAPNLRLLLLADGWLDSIYSVVAGCSRHCNILTSWAWAHKGQRVRFSSCRSPSWFRLDSFYFYFRYEG